MRARREWKDHDTVRVNIMATFREAAMADPIQKEAMGAFIQFQRGPVGEVGCNGIQVEDLLEVCLDRLRQLNREPFDCHCRENALAITKVEEALMWLDRRTQEREHRGVEGTSRP